MLNFSVPSFEGPQVQPVSSNTGSNPAAALFSTTLPLASTGKVLSKFSSHCPLSLSSHVD